MYKHSNNKTMTSNAIAAMLSTILYSRRFFPYYVYNIIGGLDEEGKGAVYSFDPVGSYQRDAYKAGGSASAMLQPLLDNQAKSHCKSHQTSTGTFSKIAAGCVALMRTGTIE
ncbi:hypothetical protein AB205_0044020 [Aquarana catesbeiana]|uniref:Uncharacterized protein n=1 Tax=Aquarana catesbeiana TaxID=8400 RepID=A0A2G9RIM7_AQUCT|nr:hypothetical protein AB205_0044020 [Aquarana catesbeiana]